MGREYSPYTMAIRMEKSRMGKASKCGYQSAGTLMMLMTAKLQNLSSHIHQGVARSILGRLSQSTGLQLLKRMCTCSYYCGEFSKGLRCGKGKHAYKDHRSPAQYNGRWIILDDRMTCAMDGEVTR